MVTASVHLLGCLGDYDYRVRCAEKDVEFGGTLWSGSVRTPKEE